MSTLHGAMAGTSEDTSCRRSKAASTTTSSSTRWRR